MSDPRKPIASILLKKSGKTTAISLYDFAEFSGQNEDSGLYRVKIDGRWHSPVHKYTPFNAQTVAVILREMLSDEQQEQPAPVHLKRSMRVFAHWEPEHDEDPGCGTAWTLSPPHLGHDGRWHIWIDGPRLVRCEDVRPLKTRHNAKQEYRS